MKYDELSTLTIDELNDKLIEFKEELFNLRFQHAVNQLENTSRLKAVRKDIARVKTCIRQMQLSVANA
jgi:large subunit ribosomal protein L29